MQKDRRAAGAADLIHNQLTARVIEVLTSILAPSRREGHGTLRTNPRCAARDDRNLVLNLTHRGPPSREF